MPDGSHHSRTLSAAHGIAADALAGLSQKQKTLPAKLFYDDEGCRLFGEITRLPEYYVTRTERAVLAQAAMELAPDMPVGGALVEYGASDETKAAILLEHMPHPSAYVPIDVAGGALQALTARMGDSHPGLAVLPLTADFLAPLALPPEIDGKPIVGFFPGSTIGNLDPAMARRFLSQVRATLGAGATFLVGVDLRKDPSVLVPAYDDAQGVTAAFNRNLLVRLNREAGGDFDLAAFRHRAVWNDQDGRIEMHLESLRPQTAHVAGVTFSFAAGETIHTENSYKHTIEGFQALAASAGWRPEQVWADERSMFSLHLLRHGIPS